MADSLTVIELLLRARDETAGAFASLHGRVATASHAAQVGFEALGVAAAGVLVVATKQAADYQSMLTHIQANTGMTTGDLAAMSKGIQDLSAGSGAKLDQLAEGFMHIHNFGFSAADAMRILKPAMESALSTGDDVGKVASALAVAMHEFHLNADQAQVSMNLLHVAAQEGNSTLGDFVDSTTRAFNVAGGFGVKLQDIAAALSTLTQSGQTARSASDGMSAAMFSIVKPTSAATAALNFLSHETGVNLVQDFSAVGLRTRGLTNIIGDVRLAINRMGGDTNLQRKTMLDYADALERNNVTGDKFVTAMTKMAKSIGDPTQALIGLFPNVRAFREMMLLTGSQADSFATHVRDMGKVVSGQVDPTLQGFNNQQKTLAGQMAKMDANLKIAAITLGTALIPALTKMMVAMVPIIKVVSEWIAKHPQLTVAILAGTAALGALAAVLPGLIALFGALRVASLALLGPWGLVIAGAILLVTHLDDIGSALDKASNKMNAFLHLGTQATGVFSASQSVQFVAKWLHSGNDMMEGLAAGMFAKMSAVDKAGVAAAERATTATKTALQSKSPSMVFHRIGQDVAQGLINGMASMHEKVHQTAATLAANVAAGATGLTVTQSASGTPLQGRIPLAAMGATYMQTLAGNGVTGGGAGGRSDASAAQAAQQRALQTNILVQMRDFLQSSSQGIDRMAHATVNGALPHPPAPPHLQLQGVARPRIA